MFNVCIISCGMIANSAHIPAYRTFPEDFRITGVCDINEAAARETARRYGVPYYFTNPEKMLKKQKPDVVSVCVPNCYHKEYTIMALEYGAHVLCEKPMAFTYADAMEMFTYAKKNKRLLMACQSMRFTPDRLAAKTFIESGGLDTIYYGEFSRIRRRGIPAWGAFHMKNISCGGAFVDIGVHMVDALVWLMGNPKIKSVCASLGRNHQCEIGSLRGSGDLAGEVKNAIPFDPAEMDVEDFACGRLNFENGASVNFKVAWASNMPEASDIRLVSKKAGLDIPACKIYTGEHGEETLKTVPLQYMSPFAGHIYLADNLLKAMKGRTEPFVRPAETLNVARILELFYQSAEAGREVFANEA